MSNKKDEVDLAVGNLSMSDTDKVDLTVNVLIPLNSAFRAHGINNLDARYQEDVRGLKDGIAFFRDGAAVTKASMMEMIALRINHQNLIASQPINSPATVAAAKGEMAWLTSFREFVLDGKTNFWIDPNYSQAIISLETASQDPFKHLMENATKRSALTPVEWDLSEKRMSGVVQGLNNIALMTNHPDVHFQLEKGRGKVTFYSDTLSADALDHQVTDILQHIVSFDKNLTNEQKTKIVNQMSAFKKDRNYVAFEKETGFKPDYLVDLVENAQIATAATTYLKFTGVQVDNQEPYLVQKKDGQAMTADGKDNYKITNPNRTRSGKTLKEDAAIPALQTPSYFVVPTQSEAEMIDALNSLRGTMPVELSPEPPSAPKPAGVKKASAAQIKAH